MHTKYRPAAPVPLMQRQWPTNTLTKAPRWLSTDLRDGNQALFEPMSVEQKLAMFEALCQIGFKEIEVGFPSASATEQAFVRRLIEEGRIPGDVTLQVLAPVREALIEKTLESLRGAPRVIVHLYNATSPQFRETVFQMTPSQVKSMAVKAVQFTRAKATELLGEAQVQLEYSAEHFTTTELPFALEVFEAVMEAWGATPDNPVILNLPATVEVSTPNTYADQVEWVHQNLSRRDCVVLSTHPHNDRGTAVAAAELAQLAGADRVEGCLFGNGERTGNVDLVTLALNLHTQGIDSQLDFSNLSEVARLVESCTQLPIHPRHPYAGDLVFTAFSGSHQDAIKKGMAQQKTRPYWDVPYLPLDPADVGRSYDSLIRVNSQSGKGGIAYLMERKYGITMPRRLQIEFSALVQAHADQSGKEVSASDLWLIFSREFLDEREEMTYVGHHLFEDGTEQRIQLETCQHGERHTHWGRGNGPISAAVNALGRELKVLSFEERAIGQGAEAKACAFIELQGPGAAPVRYGVGIHDNITTASVMAVVSALRRNA